MAGWDIDYQIDSWFIRGTRAQVLCNRGKQMRQGGLLEGIVSPQTALVAHLFQIGFNGHSVLPLCSNRIVRYPGHLCQPRLNVSCNEK